MGIEAILALGGLILPPTVQLLKDWLMGPSRDTPEATMSTLATTKPEVLGPYVESLASYLSAQGKFFNRDVIGTPSQWIVDLRAGIRPIVTAVATVALIGEGLMGLWFPEAPVFLDAGTRGLFILTTSSWFGGRIVNGNGK